MSIRFKYQQGPSTWESVYVPAEIYEDKALSHAAFRFLLAMYLWQGTHPGEVIEKHGLLHEIAYQMGWTSAKATKSFNQLLALGYVVEDTP